MSTALSTSAMVPIVQRRMANGISSTIALEYLNEAFRKLNQMQKGGFIWQLKSATLGLGLSLTVAAPSDFDPGKGAWIRGDGIYDPLKTVIPYKNWQEFTQEQHFQTITAGVFSSWTFLPNFTFGPPTNYAWTIQFAPAEAIVTVPPGPTLPMIYHAQSFAGLTAAPNVYFPTPNEFDSMIMDLAVAEGKKQYRLSGWQDEAAQANAAIAEVIDTYRTNRYDLAGLFDQVAQAKEKDVEKAK